MPEGVVSTLEELEALGGLDATKPSKSGARLETIIPSAPEPRIVEVPNEAPAPTVPPNTPNTPAACSSEPSPPDGSSASGTSVVLATFEIHEPIGSLQQTLQTACPAREPIIDGLIDRGQIVVFGAKPGTGKTPLITQLSGSAACGVTCLSYAIPTPRRVGFIDVESSPSGQRSLLERQCRALQLDRDLLLRNMDVFVLGNPHDANSRELERIFTCNAVDKLRWLGSLVRKRQYDLLFIDTILSFLGIKSTDEGHVRAMFRMLYSIRSTPPFPAIGLAIHLRKGSERGRESDVALIDDPRRWTEEFLGVGVWSASADVRLGMEPYGAQALHKVFSGFRRIDGNFTPRLIEEEFAMIDGEMVPQRWVQIDPALALDRQLTEAEKKRFADVPVGQDLTWVDLVRICEGSKATASRLLTKARAAHVMTSTDGVHRRIV